jgi:phenylpyruvate tautomerase PptA (4-oxalocrotonate tautomerase family)
MEEPIMPLIQVKLSGEVFTPTHKKEFVTKLTNAVVPIEGENMPAATRADIENLLPDEWDFGVSGMTIDAIRILTCR